MNSSTLLPALPEPAQFARRRWAARALFFSAGLLFATWGVHIPTVKAVYGLGVGAVGALILVVGIGALVGLTQAGWLIGRFGAGPVAWLGGLVSAATIALLLQMPNVPVLWLLLALYGAASGLVDVAMNTDASELEQSGGRPLMSGFHAMFSFGGMAGAALGSVVLSGALAPRLHLAAIALCTAVAFTWAVRSAGAAASSVGIDPSRPPGKRFSLPRGRLALLGLMAGLGLIVEGAMYDWSVLFLQSERSAPPPVAALAYASFSGAMALTRLAGDSLRARWSSVALLCGSASLAALALAMVLMVDQLWLALAGFALIGVGLANVVPVLFSAAAQVPGVSAAHGISSVASIGYFGLMVGPSAIGLIAHRSSLSVALGMVVVCALALALAAPYALRGAVTPK